MNILRVIHRGGWLQADLDPCAPSQWSTLARFRDLDEGLWWMTTLHELLPDIVRDATLDTLGFVRVLGPLPEMPGVLDLNLRTELRWKIYCDIATYRHTPDEHLVGSMFVEVGREGQVGLVVETSVSSWHPAPPSFHVGGVPAAVLP